MRDLRRLLYTIPLFHAGISIVIYEYTELSSAKPPNVALIGELRTKAPLPIARALSSCVRGIALWAVDVRVVLVPDVVEEVDLALVEEE